MDDDHPNVLKGPNLPRDLPAVTVGQYIFSRLKSRNPYDVLLCEAESGRTMSPVEFLGLSMKVAEGLKAAGLQRGDVVCIMGRVGIGVYATATGTLFQGGTVHPLDHTLPPDVFRQILKTTKPKFVFCDAEFAEGVVQVLSQLEFSGPVVLYNSEAEDESPHQAFERFAETPVDFGRFRPVAAENPEESVAFLVCSSGTMGVPKPVMITDRNLVYQATVWSILGSFNKVMTCPSITFSYFFWISGVLVYLMVVSINFELIMVRRLEANHVLSVIERLKPVWGVFSPALAKYLTSHPDFENHDVSSLMLMITGGSALQKALVAKIKKGWGDHLACRQSYGATETAGSATSCGLDDDVLSVGRLIPGSRMKIVSLVDASLLGPGQEGEILIKSPSVMKGYLGNEQATREATEDGWYRTGDVGRYTDAGLIYVTGRKKDFFLFDDKQVSPTEIEEVIMSLPGVVDVGVVGLKGEDANCLPLALVLKAQGFELAEEDVVNRVKDRLEDHKHLRGGVYFVDHIPRTASGKMKRADLLDLAESLRREA